MIDPRIMSLKEKCITIIKALVENFKTIQMDKGLISLYLMRFYLPL